MNSKIKISFLIIAILSLLYSPTAWAEEPSGGGESSGTNYYGLLGGIDSEVTSITIDPNDKPTAIEVLAISSRGEFFRSIFNMILGFIGMVAMIIILMGGYYYITAQGEDGQIDKAKKMIIAAIIGMLVVIASYTIVATVLGLGEESGGFFEQFFSQYL